ncbi:MAG: ABC transporter permease [Lactobacillales bacterium]|nr:ABC transporter permease [Lactobacillales bacterium]
MDILKLITLEFQKMKIKKKSLLKTFLIIFGCILLVTIMNSEFGSSIFDVQTLEEAKESFLEMPILTEMVYLIYMAVLLNKFIISEFSKYKAKNIFIYPYSRKQLILSKLFCVCIITFFELILIEVMQYTLLSFLSPSSFKYNFCGVGGWINILTKLLEMLITVMYGIISLYFGVILKSSNATITASILIIAFGMGSIGDFSLREFPLTPILFSALGIFLTIMLLKKISYMDVL